MVLGQLVYFQLALVNVSQGGVNRVQRVQRPAWIVVPPLSGEPNSETIGIAFNSPFDDGYINSVRLAYAGNARLRNALRGSGSFMTLQGAQMGTDVGEYSETILPEFD